MGVQSSLLESQAPAAGNSGVSVAIGTRVIPLVTRATSTPSGRTLSEGYLSQPTIMAAMSAWWLRAHATINLEGLTLRKGELVHGAWGEGFVDRRHPHAYVHELMVGAVAEQTASLSLFAGRGYVPFGSDDPMVRPFAGFPNNHHLAQILERLVIVASTRVGALVGEMAVFNGDEPLDASTPPLFRRFADSWAARLTLRGDRLALPLAGMELFASFAGVTSPEFREGAGLDQRKAHVGLRIAGASSPREGWALSHYALAEWARTVDVDRGRSLYAFTSLLSEAALCHRAAGIAVRLEQSDRPEEERLVDLFRAARPATDNSIVGVTRWNTTTIAIGSPGVGFGVVRASPFLEVARVAVTRASAGAFDPTLFYGSRNAWRLSAGARLGAGAAHRRMGRYGVAADHEKNDDGASARHPHLAHRETRCFP